MNPAVPAQNGKGEGIKSLQPAARSPPDGLLHRIFTPANLKVFTPLQKYRITLVCSSIRYPFLIILANSSLR
jgi:hypothetical protein